MNYTDWFKDILRDPETGERLEPKGNGFFRKEMKGFHQICPTIGGNESWLK